MDLPSALAFTVHMRAVKQADEFMFDMGDVGHLQVELINLLRRILRK